MASSGRSSEEGSGAGAGELEKLVRERTRLLAAAKAEWELSFDAIRDPLAVIDGCRRVRRANIAYASMGGRPVTRVTGLSCFEALFSRSSPCDGCELLEVIDGGSKRTFSCRHGGRRFRVDAHRLSGGKDPPARAVVCYRDVTEEEIRARQIVQTEKLAALGQLAGGVAHEINNPMAGVLAFAQMMRAEPGRSPEDLEQLAYIEASTRRCIRIVESLLSLGRPTGGGPAGPVDVVTVFADARVLLQSSLERSGTRLTLSVEPEAEEVRGDAASLTQVVLNLLGNAVREAGHGGEVRGHVTRSGGGTRIVVEDSGPGVDESMRARIFDPFFTGRPEGTGLGLAISHRIVEAHSGSIRVDQSELGGARFTVELPAAGEG